MGSSFLPSLPALPVTAEVLLSRPGGHYFVSHLFFAFCQPSCPEVGAVVLEADGTGRLGPASPPFQPRPAGGLSDSAAPTMTALLPSPHRCVRAAAPWLPPPASPLLRLSLASCPALLPPLALTPVIGWFLTLPLLLLSHSDASVVAVENRYPCLFFFCYYPD